MKVRVHYKSLDAWDWRAFDTVMSCAPRQGEFIRLDESHCWYEIQSVVYDLRTNENPIEIFAVESEMSISYHGDLDAPRSAV